MICVCVFLFTGYRLCHQPLRINFRTFGYSDAFNFTELQSRSSTLLDLLEFWICSIAFCLFSQSFIDFIDVC